MSGLNYNAYTKYKNNMRNVDIKHIDDAIVHALVVNVLLQQPNKVFCELKNRGCFKDIDDDIVFVFAQTDTYVDNSARWDAAWLALKEQENKRFKVFVFFFEVKTNVKDNFDKLKAQIEKQKKHDLDIYELFRKHLAVDVNEYRFVHVVIVDKYTSPRALGVDEVIVLDEFKEELAEYAFRAFKKLVLENEDLLKENFVKAGELLGEYIVAFFSSVEKLQNVQQNSGEVIA